MHIRSSFLIHVSRLIHWAAYSRQIKFLSLALTVVSSVGMVLAAVVGAGMTGAQHG
jgi:hypothetical protein